ncbi:hypothetical protein NDU88_007313 [Pleurodeles waltl]|uniref:Uncharacterized protein n=1 Tax=Pleurodeles waltl TaxID=8319 RepID=A0AAV7NSW7_PLEWA|nr:hypothetical protein NDU88_007313 [Pleurodeles waltl]
MLRSTEWDAPERLCWGGTTSPSRTSTIYAGGGGYPIDFVLINAAEIHCAGHASETMLGWDYILSRTSISPAGAGGCPGDIELISAAEIHVGDVPESLCWDGTTSIRRTSISPAGGGACPSDITLISAAEICGGRCARESLLGWDYIPQ